MALLCEKVLGNVSDAAYMAGLEARLGPELTIDRVDFDWHEAYKRLHRKTSEGGRDVGVRLGDWVLTRGIAQGDVLGVDETGEAPVLVVANLLPTSCLVMDVDPGHVPMLARVGWEVGNTHTPLFYGEGELQLVCEHTEPVERLLRGLHGVEVRVEERVLDPARRVSSAAHVHEHGHDHGEHQRHEHGHGHGHGEHEHGHAHGEDHHQGHDLAEEGRAGRRDRPAGA